MPNFNDLLNMLMALLGGVLVILVIYQIAKQGQAIHKQDEFIHILEEELNEIHREQDMFADWISATDVILAGLNDENQKGKPDKSFSEICTTI